MTSLREDNLGVMDVHGNLTSFGQELLKALDDEAEFKAAIAKHLITAKGGLAFCRALEALGRSGKPTRSAIAIHFLVKGALDFAIGLGRDHRGLACRGAVIRIGRQNLEHLLPYSALGQRENRVWILIGSPKRSGRSRQGMPARKRQITASTNSRLSFAVTPT
jgi:hypothetical protein